jgi:glycosyltransferase involved in cell wall biosynthesis
MFYMKTFGLPRNIPVMSNLCLGAMNSLRIPKDDVYFCEGPAELFPFLHGRPKGSKIIALMNEATIYEMDWMNDKKRKFLLRLFSLVDVFVTATEYYAQLTEQYTEKPVFVHPPFCAQPFFDVDANINGNKLMFIAEKDRKKGLEELVKAVQLLPHKEANWELYAVGRSGNQIKHKVGRVHLEGYVKSLRPYMKRCSIYIHPASFDVFGVSALEAMSAGMLPIITRSSGISEYMPQNLSNVLIENNRPETIAAKIIETKNYSSARKRTISMRCRKFVKNGFTEKENVSQFRKIFAEACSL